MRASGDGFLSRWARRKAEAKGGAAEPEAPAVAAAPGAAGASIEAPVSAAASVANASNPAPVPPPPAAPAAEAKPLPTLADVARLTADSDFSPFVARDVDAGVRNAAMKKLFSDPHFNVMDGLDTYIDDYGKADPIPLSMLRRMNQAIALGLFDDEAETAAPQASPPPPLAAASPDGADPVAMAQSESPVDLPDAPDPRADDHSDLQLQPDDDDRRAGAGPGPRG